MGPFVIVFFGGPRTATAHALINAPIYVMDLVCAQVITAARIRHHLAQRCARIDLHCACHAVPASPGSQSAHWTQSVNWTSARVVAIARAVPFACAECSTARASPVRPLHCIPFAALGKVSSAALVCGRTIAVSPSDFARLNLSTN